VFSRGVVWYSSSDTVTIDFDSLVRVGTLPDGKIIGKATDKEECTVQLEESLKTTAKQKKNMAAQCKEEERWACTHVCTHIHTHVYTRVCARVHVHVCAHTFIFIYVYTCVNNVHTRTCAR
jgi:hypothetical protein